MGEIINKLRQGLGVSLIELSEETNISMYNLSLILNGVRNAKKEELGLIFFFLQSKFTNSEHKTNISF